MERKKRTLFAVLIATIIVVAVFSSFAINLFHQEDYHVQLPDLSENTGPDQSGDSEAHGNQFIRVEVTPETVQSVIATLSRPQSYYREIRIELWSDGGAAALTNAQVWVDGGWTRSDVTAPSGMVQHNLVGEETRWIWYDNDDAAVSVPANQAVSDLVQRVPTYEDVLALSPDEITDAGYEKYAKSDCIFVEVEQEELGSRERYWIAVSDGLLVAAERVKGDQTLYRMTVVSTESPAPLNSSFALPDGTVYHTVGGR
ncbi:MAG: hypothetical protein ACI4O3_04985 [Oscillospiraceae bacterium]